MNIKSDTCFMRSFLHIHTLVHLIIVHFTHVLSRKYMNAAEFRMGRNTNHSEIGCVCPLFTHAQKVC